VRSAGALVPPPGDVPCPQGRRGPENTRSCTIEEDLVIGLLSVTAAGAAGCERLAAALPGRTRHYATGEGVKEAVERAFAECDRVVCFLATGATVRLVAPLLRGKDTDPGVVCVDEAQRHAVALLGGHGGGANALATAVAGALPGCEAVITTATDAAGIPGLDTLGWPVEGAVAAVSRAVLDGTPVALRADAVWPLPAFPPNVGPADGPASPGPAYELLVTDRAVTPDDVTAVLRPPSLVVGVGASRGVTAQEVLGLVRDVLDEAGLSPRAVAALASVDAKADEPGLHAAAGQLGVPLHTYPAEALAAVEVPHPSPAPQAAVGTPSVAEAAALLATGAADLLVPKTRSVPPREGRAASATAAVARRCPRGRLAVVGLGPGARDLLTPRARDELRRASVVVGLDQYVDQIRDLLRPGTRVAESGLGAEEERARRAVVEARAGHAVALIGSGDAGVYAMASPALAEASEDVDVVGVPGVTAALAAAALLGAPLGHDHVSISLSDLHTPWEVIERRVRAAAEADLVVTFYNPRSRDRDWQLPAALDVLAGHRDPATPVGVVRNATRPGERVRVTTLKELDPATVDMMTVVTVGNTATRRVAGRMVTPRGYRWQTGACPGTSAAARR
jgi:cobalt-precorrin 5A hydrolase / cobalt-factor III methyltransferase / precorrin-3B C17-methyltransferase